MKKPIKNILNTLFVAIILVLSCYGLFKNLDIDMFVKTLSNIDWKYCVLSVPVAILSHWVRAVRWRIFLEPIKKIHSTMNLFSAVMVGYVVNNFTPRGGELVRPFVLARRENVPKSAVFATILVERFIDVIFLMLVFGVVFLASQSLIIKAFPWINSSVLNLAIAGIFVIVIALLLMLSTTFFDILIQKIVRKILPKHYQKINDIWLSFKNGFSTLKTPKSYAGIFLYSTLIWVLYAIPNYLMFFSFDFQAQSNLGVIDAGLLVVISGVGMSILPVPGGIGVYHLVVSTAIVNLYPQIMREEAFAYATISHGVNLLIQVLLGAFFMVRENIRKLPTNEE